MAALDPTFNTDVDGAIYAVTLQPDGKILIGGGFTAVNSSTRNRVARLNADGTLDTAFNPDLDVQVFDVTLQPDGKVLVGGNFTVVNGATRNRVARLNADGTLDTGFSPDVNGTVIAVTLQPDGKILTGGSFSSVNGSTRNRIARLNADGTLDTAFNPDVSGEIHAITLQVDGKILIAGMFSTVDGQPRSRRARLNADGTLDATFTAAPITSYNRQHAIVVETDGNILTAGEEDFAAARRFSSSGTLNGYVSFFTNYTGLALALQADGKLWLGGASTNASVRLRRVNADLTNDVSITPTLNGTVEALALQPDGKLLVGGAFTSVNGVTRNRIARLLVDVVPNDEIHANNDSATTLTNTPVSVNILANDTKNGVPPVDVADLQGLPTITLPPSNGTATVNLDGTVTYTPNPGFVGPDYFDYTILGKPAGS